MRSISLLLSFACVTDLEVRPEDFPENERHDYDKDGLTESEGDCDDLDPDIEGPRLWYADTDGDGFGDPNSAIESCYDDLLSEGLSYVDNSEDCNDNDETIFPNNALYEDDELCVVDADGDGYGDAIPSVSADPGNDCDDSNALVYPGYNNKWAIYVFSMRTAMASVR